MAPRRPRSGAQPPRAAIGRRPARAPSPTEYFRSNRSQSIRSRAAAPFASVRACFAKSKIAWAGAECVSRVAGFVASASKNILPLRAADVYSWLCVQNLFSFRMALSMPFRSAVHFRPPSSA